ALLRERLRLMTNRLCSSETGGLTVPMAAPAAHAATTHSAHFPALLLCQQSGALSFFGICGLSVI
ncbi:hypothetical protein, partial [Yersinia enterocolitica]|uniref:hypothetical protein n=1 Tax=Yersinia enterocolitica TaxID=630 RepID=UPI0021121CBF